jgi:hypothetical protein
LPKGWAGRDLLLRRLGEVLAGVPPRKAYYPGALDRYRALWRDLGHEVTAGERDAMS